MSPTVRTFGKYLLDEEIARGGMSRVYSARLRGLGGFEKRLVVKQVLPELARDPRFVAMFVEEAKTLVQMSHPHIAPVFELGVVDGVYFLAMEYVEGATLARIVADGPLAPELVAHLGAEVCDALHYAHTRFDVVHRDVTPRNVMVDGNGHTRLLDFGIAAPLHGVDTAVFGTPGYLSPEQLEGGSLGPASDVFALGAVLFEALSGRRAFDARTVEDTRAALAEAGPRLEPGEGPPELSAIVLRALEREVSARYGSAAELGRALRGWLASTHPEGVAPELGLRAEQAEREERRRLSMEPDPLEPTAGTREVRTLATSRALDAMLHDGQGADEAEEAGAVGTVRIERSAPPVVGPAKPEEPSEPDEPPLEPDEPPLEPTPSAAPIAPQAEPRAERAAVERAQPARALLPWTLAILAIGALAALLLSTPERPPADEAPLVAAGEPLEPRQPVEPLEPLEPREPREPREPAPTPAPPDRAAVPDPPAPSSATPSSTTPSTEPPLRVESAPRPATTLNVNASPWADVRLDGRPLGRTPQRRVPVRAGRHTVELTCPPLGRRVTHTFEAVAGEPLTLVADLTQDPPVVRSR